MSDRRREIEAFFTDENRIAGSEREELSPSGRHRLLVTRYRTRPGAWEYTRGRVVRVADGALVCDIKRNFSTFHRSWLVKDHREWLVAGRSYMSQTIVDLDRAVELEPPGDPYVGHAFCWAAAFLSRDERTLAVDGCIWACPYEYRFFDFTDPSSGWPELPIDAEDPVDVESELRPAWLEDGTFESFVARDGAIVGRTRLARQGDRMLVVERWLSDEERERREAERAAEAAEDAWWQRFRSEDPLYLEMARQIREHRLPDGSIGHKSGRTITCWFRRAEPRASADLEWAASGGAIRVQDYDDAGRRGESVEFERSTQGMARAMDFIARRFR